METFHISIIQATGFTPLMFAAKDNRLSLMERLIDLGCDLNAVNKVSRSIHLIPIQFPHTWKWRDSVAKHHPMT